MVIMEKAIVGITLGDASGIGPEIVAKLCVKGYFTQYFRPIMIGDVRVFEDGLRIIGAEYPHYVVKDVDEALAQGAAGNRRGLFLFTHVITPYSISG